MIRFLVAFAFLFSFSLPLISCTTPSSDDENATALPIEDDAPADATAGADANTGEGPAPSNDELGLSDEIEGAASGDELADKPPTQVPGKQEAAPAGDDIENEFDKEPENKTAAVEGDEIENDLSELEPAPAGKDQLADAEPVLDAPGEPVPAPVPADQQDKVAVRDIRYMSNASGGTVVIETSKPVTYQTRYNAQTQQFVIEIANAEMPASLQRPYLTKDFNSRIGSINGYQGEGSTTARVVIQMNGKGEGEPVAQQEGNSIVVIPPAPMIAQKPVTTPKAKNESPGALAARTLDEFLTGNQKFFGRLISLQVKDADIRDVVNFLAEESGANIVMSDDVKGRISLKLRRVPWDQALVTVMRSKELGYVRQGNVLRISTLKSLQSETEAANKIIEAQKAIVPAIVQVIPVNYANLDDLVKNLKPFLSKEGQVVADTRTNTVVITDKAESVDRVQKLIKTLDIPPAQVSIETKIVEAAETFSSFMGINWGFGGSDVTLSKGGGANGAPVSMNIAARSATLSRDFAGAGPFAASLGIGTLDVFGDLSATLNLAEADSLAKVISSPRISTMNREKSTITQKSENISVIKTRSEVTGSVTSQEKRNPYSLELNVTPQITSDGSVIMDLDVRREFLGARADGETGARPINTRSAKTKILVHNGQTAVIGGIYTSDETENSNGVPGLMNIPVIGWLFKTKAIDRSKNELLIFLTPRILAQDEAKAQTASAQ